MQDAEVILGAAKFLNLIATIFLQDAEVILGAAKFLNLIATVFSAPCEYTSALGFSGTEYRQENLGAALYNAGQ